MADSSLGQAYVQILPTTKGFAGKLASSLGGSEGGGHSAGLSIGKKIIGGIAAAGIGTAIFKGIKSSIDAGGELEQSLGGIEALYGKSADKIKAYASNAYKTVGISANEYMQTVTSFSASLISSLGGDTTKAANIADIAMQDMGDNANRFGTDVQSIQNAYQGFAKGNFTMLDNLKLGYGGTKNEMLRLVKDAGVVDKSVKSLDDVSFDQMILGIHKIQEGLNVTGTTAKEGATTLQGSMASFKAIITDLLGNIAVGADITPQLSALLETGQHFLIDNLIPMISNVITGIASNAGMIGETVLLLVSSVGQTIIDTAPVLLESGISLVVTLAQGLIDGLPTMIPKAVQLIADLALMLTEPSTLSSLIMSAIGILQALATGIMDSFPILAESLPVIVKNIVDTLIDHAPEMIPAAVEFIVSLGSGLVSATTTIFSAIMQVGKIIIDKFKETNWSNIGSNIIDGIKEGLHRAKQKLIDKLKEIANLLPASVKKLLGINSPSKVFIDIFKWVPIGAAVGIEQNKKYVDNALEDMVSSAGRITSGRMNLNATMRTQGASSAWNYSGLYDAIKQGASDAQPIIVFNNRVVSRELKGMGVSFA